MSTVWDEATGVDPGGWDVEETPVDWAALRFEAATASKMAYAPYSNFAVGAAGLVDGGPRVVRGCNVENAGYGVTLCAECGVVSDLHLGGGGKLTAFVCVDGAGNVIMPCGRCRQLLWENGGPNMQIETPLGVQRLSQVLPQAFGSENLS
jgi:cytidine deaminase